MKYLLATLLLGSCAHFSPSQSSSVVALLGSQGGGTGFVVSAPSGRKYILTNAHVCEIARLVDSEDRLMKTEVIEAADYTDLCLMTLPKHLDAPGLKIADFEPQTHDKIHIIGYGMLLGSTLTEGHWVGRLALPVLAVFHPAYVTAQVLPGNSGSPVLNDDGFVVGVVYASSPAILNRALVVPLEDIREFLKNY